MLGERSTQLVIDNNFLSRNFRDFVRSANIPGNENKYLIRLFLQFAQIKGRSNL